MALSIKDGTGAGASLKTTLDGVNHRPHHIIDEISGSSIGTVITSLSSAETKLTNLSSSVNSNLIIVNATITGSNTLLTTLSSSIKASNDLLSSISGSVAATSKYASSVSTTITASTYLASNTFSFTSGSALTVIATNLTNANLYLLLGSGTPSAISYTYFIPPSGSYESLSQNSRLQHNFIAPGATAGSASFTVTQ